LLPDRSHSRDSPSFAYVSSLTHVALHGVEVRGAAWVCRSPLFWCALCSSVSGEH